MAKPIVIGDRIFPTKALAQDACRAILYGYPPGTAVTDAEHHDLLQDLLMRHPDAEGKIGPGVLRFEVRPNPTFPRQRTLYLVRTDGTDTDFSFLKCITPPSHQHDVIRALRRAIAAQTMAVGARAFADGGPVACALTGELLHNTADAHVDHYEPTFYQLAVDYVAVAGGWESIPLHSGDGTIGACMADPEQEGQWWDFHEERAQLRVVSINANLSLLTRGTRVAKA